VDRLLDDRAPMGRAARVGLLTNDAARLGVAPEVLSRVALREAGVPLAALFSPEHGITAAAPDGSVVPNASDAATGLPVLSLYGERFAPPRDALEGLDVLLVDLPDVGARFYTYAWTMTHVIDACAETGTRMLVLDRPNPLGGDLATAEGPILEPSCVSFIGRFPVPIRHSITIGELALLWRRERAPAADVEVLPCGGWDRAMQWPDTGFEFVPMSPAMPAFESALLYPGLCLFEATNLSVARDGPAPFRSVAARWLDGDEIAEVVSGDARSGGVRVSGGGTVVRLEVVDRYAVRPVALGFALLEAISRRHHDSFAWTTYPTAANPSGGGHLERLVGTRVVRAHLDAGRRVPDLLLGTGDWGARVEPVRLYS
jgi:uncharacterized protein YbbC (DUF1343 family)